jgi:hypothetical protein
VRLARVRGFPRFRKFLSVIIRTLHAFRHLVHFQIQREGGKGVIQSFDPPAVAFPPRLGRKERHDLAGMQGAHTGVALEREFGSLPI